ncbi:MAG: zinc dependent phospholipase C family protein [Culicoidibacterales bacterium]
MLSPTHRLIARHVQMNVEHLSGMKLQAKIFRYGAIAPDLHPHLFFGMHHYREDSQHFVYRQMKTVVETKWTKKNAIKLSYLLGLICHFTSDYHCFPHVYYEMFSDNFRAHFRYEVALHKLSRKFKNSELELRPITKISTNLETYHQRLLQYEQLYQTTPHSLQKDIRFAIGTSSLIISELLLANQRFQEN